jgi:hypothetical protein
VKAIEKMIPEFSQKVVRGIDIGFGQGLKNGIFGFYYALDNNYFFVRMAIGINDKKVGGYRV